MKPKSVLEQLANQYTLPGGAFYMDEQGTIQTVETIADLKKYLMIKGATQVIYVKAIDRFVESDSSGVADEVTSWASTHPKRKGYRWVLQAVATAASSVAPYMDFNKEGGGTVRLTFGSEGQPIYTILSCLMLLFSSITGYAQSARTSPLIDRTTHVLAWPSDLWTTNAAAIAAALPAGSLGTNQLNAQTYGLLVGPVAWTNISSTPSALTNEASLRALTLKSALLPGFSYGTGTSAVLVANSNGRLSQGLQPRTIRMIVGLPDWTPAANVTLYDNVASALGQRIVLATSGKFRVHNGDGTNIANHYFETSFANTLAENTAAELVFIDDPLTETWRVYINGEQLGSTLATHAVRYRLRTSTAPHRFLSDGTTHFSGELFERVVICNRTFTSSEVASAYADPRLWQSANLGVGDFQGSIYGTSSDMSGAGDWTGVGSVVTANYDSGNTGHSSTLRIESNDGTSDYGQNATVVLVAGRRYRLQYEYKTAGDPGTNTVRLVNMSSSSLPVPGQTLGVNGLALADSWTRSYYEWTSTVTGTVQLWMFAALSGGDATAELILDNVYFTPVGVVAEWDVSTPGKTKRDLSGQTMTGNGLHAYLPVGSKDFLQVQDPILYGFLEWSASNASQVFWVAGLDPLATGDEIEVWAKSTTGEHWVIGDEADADRYFAEATIATSWTKLTLANATPDGTNLDITAVPMDGAAAAESRTDRLDIAVRVKRVLKLN